MKEEHKIYFRGSLILREQNARYVIFKRKEKKRKKKSMTATSRQKKAVGGSFVSNSFAVLIFTGWLAFQNKIDSTLPERDHVGTSPAPPACLVTD